MSNTSIFQFSGFVKTPLQNGVGRFVSQLQRITFKFCKGSGDSCGMREFIEKELIGFAKLNPGVVVYLKPRRNHKPYLKAEYLNGEEHSMNFSNFSSQDIIKWVDYFRTRSGEKIIRHRKYHHTEYPSVQGVWNPWTHKDPQLNIATFPNESLSKKLFLRPTATEVLQEMFEQQKLDNKEEQTAEQFVVQRGPTEKEERTKELSATGVSS